MIPPWPLTTRDRRTRHNLEHHHQLPRRRWDAVFVRRRQDWRIHTRADVGEARAWIRWNSSMQPRWQNGGKAATGEEQSGGPSMHPPCIVLLNIASHLLGSDELLLLWLIKVLYLEQILVIFVFQTWFYLSSSSIMDISIQRATFCLLKVKRAFLLNFITQLLYHNIAE